MVLLFFPTVAVRTASHVFAALVVLRHESILPPVWADTISVISENMRLSSEVLVVVSVRTLRLVVIFVEGTPLSLEVKHVEIMVLLHLMNKSSLELFVAMCK